MEGLDELRNLDFFYRFGLALLIGFLIGLQREFAGQKQGEEQILFGGARTFPLLGLMGCAAAWLSFSNDSIWPLLIVFLVFGALLAVSYHHAALAGNFGLTTEVSAILTIIIGAFCFYGELAIAAALGVGVAVLLALKFQTRTLAKNLTRDDIFATLKFAVITVIILPLLPQTPFAESPFDVLIPYKIWLMVIFISGISFLGYILIKFIGTERAVGITGLLGGLASSTAVTLSFSQKSRDEDSLSKPLAYAILIAWCVMFVRVMIEVAAINASLLPKLIVPLLGGLIACLGWAGKLYFSKSEKLKGETGNFKNPFRLGPAILFGVIYAAVLLISNLAQIHLGSTGIYLSSVASALVDVDAITLSLSQLSRSESVLSHETASNAIVLAAATNTLVKGGIVFTLGSKAIRKAILPGILLTVGVTLLLGLLF